RAAAPAATGPGLVLNACNGAASQNWNITAVAQNGSFNVTAASTGRCMSVRGASPSPGAVMEVDNCVSGSASQMFNIQATVNVNDTSGATGTGGSTSTGGSTGT